MPDLRLFILAWAGLAILVAAGLWLLGKAYQRGFRDGVEHEIEEVKAAEPLTDAEVEVLFKAMPLPVPLECPNCGQRYDKAVVGPVVRTVPHG